MCSGLQRLHTASSRAPCYMTNTVAYLLLELCACPHSWLAAVLLGGHCHAWKRCMLLQGGWEGCGDGTTTCRADAGMSHMVQS
jgi:hypothetical protein